MICGALQMDKYLESSSHKARQHKKFSKLVKSGQISFAFKIPENFGLYQFSASN